MTSSPPLESIDPVFFSNFTLVSLMILGVVVAIVTVWSLVRLRPPHEAPTRREFDALSAKVDETAASLQPMERRILAAVSSSGKEVRDELNALATSEHEGRTRIWEQLHKENKDIVARVARVEALQNKS